MADSSFRVNRGITLNPQATAPTSPTNGDVYYDSVLGTFAFYDNGFWINLASRGDVASALTLTSTDFPASTVANSIIRITGATAGTIHGVTASTDGNMVVIYNNTNQLINIANQSVTEGTVINRIVTHTGRDITIPAGMTLKLVYDSAQSRWVFAAPAIDGLDKLFEDRNILLTQGGLITYTGTTVQFTEALAMEINQRETGVAPVVISLGSTTRAISATGRMIYAVIDRVAGTAIVTDDAATLPPAVPVNQEVFLIAKRVDAADGTKRLYWRNGMALNEGQTVRLGASGSGGSGNGTGDDINTLRFKASFTDEFAEGSTSLTSAVNSTLTTAVYNAAGAAYRLSYDAANTVTGTGTAMTLSGTPAYTVVAGDILVVGTEARRIVTVTTQTSYVIESAFTVDPTAAVACVSQAVHTNDVRAHTENSTGLAMNTLISDPVSTFMLRYRDSASLGDFIWDFPGTALIAVSASADNTSWSNVFTRTTALDQNEPIRSVPVSGSQFRARFFANASSGSGAVNILDYKTYLHEGSGTSSGTTMDQAYCLTSGAGAEINCSVSSDTGKTRITTTWAYATSVNPGTQQGQIMVMLDGKVLPRFIDNTLTASGYYKEISAQVIELDADYSGAGLEVDIKKWVSAVDTTSQNSSNLAYLQDMSTAGFQGFVDESAKVAVPNTTIIGRAQIPDLANDLKARMGVERISVQQAIELQKEFGANGERVFGALNDDRNLIRFVGNWVNANNDTGARPNSSANITDYLEIVFYGTGLNILSPANVNRDYRASVDGGAEGGNLFSTGYSAVLVNKNYATNQVIQVVSGLALGLHTVKIRNNSVSFFIDLYGFEILNESANVNVRPGTAYNGGKKLVMSSASSVAYNTGFETVTREGAAVAFSSTRGARVLEYLKSDGTKGKSAYLTNTTQGNLASASHDYEEIIRTYNWREFGAARADDFSTLPVSQSDRVFTLEDGTTTLTGRSVQTAPTGPDGLYIGTNSVGFVTLTFVGTGLDMSWYGDATGSNSNANSFEVFVNGVSVGNWDTAAVNGQVKTKKIVSGLPYGTHTVKVFKNVPNLWTLHLTNFTVYGPKKPSIPAGAVELADYNVMADFVANTTSTAENISTGTLRKTPNREMIYVEGTGGANPWTTNYGISNGAINFVNLVNDTLGGYFEYTFFGTGFEYRLPGGGSGSANVTCIVNGTALNASYPSASSINCSVYGGTITYGGQGPNSSFLLSAVASNIMNQGTTGVGNGFRVSNLPLAKYTVRFTQSAAAGNVIRFSSFDVITPIHAPQSSIPGDIQNTLPTGSCTISDSRLLSIVKSESPKKFRGVAVAVVGGATTTSGTYIPVPNMSLVVPSKGGWFEMNYSLNTNGTAVDLQLHALFINGVKTNYAEKRSTGASVGVTLTIQGIVSDSQLIYLSPGTHKVELYWLAAAGTARYAGDGVNLTVKEL
jgi:hypothetical protein